MGPRGNPDCSPLEWPCVVRSRAANGRSWKLRALGARLDDGLFVLVTLALIGGFVIATVLLRPCREHCATVYLQWRHIRLRFSTLGTIPFHMERTELLPDMAMAPLDMRQIPLVALLFAPRLVIAQLGTPTAAFVRPVSFGVPAELSSLSIECSGRDCADDIDHFLPDDQKSGHSHSHDDGVCSGSDSIGLADAHDSRTTHHA